jgi:hypothetical protein
VLERIYGLNGSFPSPDAVEKLGCKNQPVRSQP